jgi:hypothetical protein
MKLVSVFISLFFSINVLSQLDTAHIIKVNCLYGSKPKRKYRETEFKSFGGLHGGHISIQIGDSDYGFEPTTRVHVFANKRRIKSNFVVHNLNGKLRYSETNKTLTFLIPLTNEQYKALNQILNSYCKNSPYDYAFFGMRCASATQDILAQIGIVKKRKRFTNIVTTFYPKKLRKRLFKLAYKNNYQLIKTNGRKERKWEMD